jgi:hypothetical protein
VLFMERTFMCLVRARRSGVAVPRVETPGLSPPAPLGHGLSGQGTKCLSSDAERPRPGGTVAPAKPWAKLFLATSGRMTDAKSVVPKSS